MLPLKYQIELELRKIIKPEVYDEWMNSPNVELDFKTPQELLKRQDYSPLWVLIYNHDNVNRLAI